MLSPKQTAAVFTLEGINSFATTLYFYYLYFFTERQFAFTKFQNLLLAAAMGLAYAGASMLGGRFAQRRGYFTALKFGYGVMTLAIGAAALTGSLPVQLPIMFVAYCGAAFTWPALESLACEGQPRRAVQRNLGIYNLVWGGTGAVAYFCGGSIIDAAGFRTLFVISASLCALQLIATMLLARGLSRSFAGTRPASEGFVVDDGDRKPTTCSPIPPQTFLRMAWLANPFAYLAINTVVAVMPNVAHRLSLSVAQAGVFCSIWLFVRTGSFLLMWLWAGWHYRFRWLITAYAALALSFVIMLISGNLWTLIAAQIAFGLALGLIYCSSLYYSMDVGTEAKGEHGGWHEAMIGLGSFAGPAIGAAGIHFFPRVLNSSTWAAGALLLLGFAGLLLLRFNRKRT